MRYKGSHELSSHLQIPSIKKTTPSPKQQAKANSEVVKFEAPQLIVALLGIQQLKAALEVKWTKIYLDSGASISIVADTTPVDPNTSPSFYMVQARGVETTNQSMSWLRANSEWREWLLSYVLTLGRL